MQPVDTEQDGSDVEYEELRNSDDASSQGFMSADEEDLLFEQALEQLENADAENNDDEDNQDD